MSHAGAESERRASANIQSKLAIMKANDFLVFGSRYDLGQRRIQRVIFARSFGG
jgi:hypothetical protein